MNGKKAKTIRRQAKLDMVDWLKSLLTEEEQSNVTVDNVLQLAPKQTHVRAFGQFKHSVYSFKWFVKQVKLGKDWKDAIG